MSKRYDSHEVRETIGALDRAKVRAAEIQRRLNDGEAGLPYKVPIKRRQVYTYRQQYREQHGPPKEPDVGEATVNSIEAIEQRIIDLMAREVAHFERKRPGNLSVEDSRRLNAHHQALLSIERRARKDGKRNGPAAKDEDDEPESVLDRLAREQRESEIYGQRPS